jgi:hypothetical protein
MDKAGSVVAEGQMKTSVDGVRNDTKSNVMESRSL